MFHLLIQLLHSEKFEDLSFKHFVVVTFSDTLGNILCLVNHFQCIKVFANEIHVLFDQAYKRAMVQILLTNFVYPFFKGSEKREKKNDDTLLPGHMRIYRLAGLFLWCCVLVFAPGCWYGEQFTVAHYPIVSLCMSKCSQVTA